MTIGFSLLVDKRSARPLQVLWIRPKAGDVKVLGLLQDLCRLVNNLPVSLSDPPEMGTGSQPPFQDVIDS